MGWESDVGIGDATVDGKKWTGLWVCMVGVQMATGADIKRNGEKTRQHPAHICVYREQSAIYLTQSGLKTQTSVESQPDTLGE
jgi:hypothetical protein